MIYHFVIINHSYSVNIELYDMRCFLKSDFDYIVRHNISVYKLYVIAKCIEVYQEYCTLGQTQFANWNQNLGHIADQNCKIIPGSVHLFFD